MKKKTEKQIVDLIETEIVLSISEGRKFETEKIAQEIIFLFNRPKKELLRYLNNL